MIRNRSNKKSVAEGGNQLPTDMSLKAFGDAMSQCDLSGVPPERRRLALKAHMLKVMAHHLDDRELGQAISLSHFEHLLESSRLK